MVNIETIAKKYEIENYAPYGEYMAKINPITTSGKGKVILVTATNPTKYGEGKTTTAIGLTDALNQMGIKAIGNLREPSMGPVFGLKGGATGGGKAVMLPEAEINLHFTGDFHAITSANNLICAMIDNEIYHGNKLDLVEVTFKRCLDMNDRALRHIELDGRKESFEITAASEIMAILCLSKNIFDLRMRLDSIIIGYNSQLQPVYLSALHITDALISLLIEAIKPNLVQTGEGNGVVIHGGPFANIAHGCSSLISLTTSTNLADYVITEAGFGADAGAFKFMDILMRENKINLGAIVLVTSVRALKQNGDGDLSVGIENLHAHVDNLQLMNKNLVVTINRFSDDDEKDILFIQKYCDELGVLCTVNTVYQDGGKGAITLAEAILSFEEKNEVSLLYGLEDTLYDKIQTYVTKICHGAGFTCSFELMQKMNELNKYKYPICVAKTQYSLSDKKSLLGYPKGHTMKLTNIEVKNGAKLIVVYFGGIITMPGLNEFPSAKEILYQNGEIILPR